LMTKRNHFFVWTRILKNVNALEGTICIYENIEMMCHMSIYVINGVSVCNIYIYAIYIYTFYIIYDIYILWYVYIYTYYYYCYY
jgi:hypothetical protein